MLWLLVVLPEQMISKLVSGVLDLFLKHLLELELGQEGVMFHEDEDSRILEEVSTTEPQSSRLQTTSANFRFQSRPSTSFQTPRRFTCSQPEQRLDPSTNRISSISEHR